MLTIRDNALQGTVSSVKDVRTLHAAAITLLGDVRIYVQGAFKDIQGNILFSQYGWTLVDTIGYTYLTIDGCKYVSVDTTFDVCIKTVT